MQRDSHGIGCRKFLLERYGFRWVRFHDRSFVQTRSALVVKVCYQMARVEHTKFAGKPDRATGQTTGLERPNKNARITYSMEFFSGSRWEPFSVHGATLSRSQVAHGTVQFCFKIIWGRIGILAHRDFTFIRESHPRSIGPKDYGSFPGVGAARVIVEAFYHRVLAGAINDGQPPSQRIQPQFGSHVGIVHSEETVVAHGHFLIFGWSKANVIAIQVGARRIRWSECP